jgi:hypothetical protein
VQRFAKALHTHLAALRVEPASADRGRTAQATFGLLAAILGADKEGIVDAIASAHISTSETAMGQCMKKAPELAAALENAQWGLFDAIGSLPEAHRTRAEGIVDSLKTALAHDEHVTPLAPSLKKAQSDALALLAEAARKPEPPLPPVVPRGKSLVKEGHQQAKASDADQVFSAIRSDVAEVSGQPTALLEVEWKIYTEQ